MSAGFSDSSLWRSRTARVQDPLPPRYSLGVEPAECPEAVGGDAYVVLGEQAFLALTPRADGRRERSEIVAHMSANICR